MKLGLLLALAWMVLPAAAQTVNVTGEAEIKVVPDEAVLSLGVEAHAKVLNEARRENDRRVRAVRAAAARMGIAERDIQTDFIQMGMAYESDEVTPKYYYTRMSMVLTLRDVNRVEEVLAAAVDAGATHIHGVEFETTKLREYRDQARALAVQAAEKARDMAGAAGLKVAGGPVSISAANYGSYSWYGSGWGPRYRGGMQNVTMSGGSEGGMGTGTVALGRISVTATVSMQFRIE